jgi:hypothetical protein
VAVLGLFSVIGMSGAGLSIVRDHLKSDGASAGLVLGTLLGLLVLFGGVVSFTGVSLRALAVMKYLRSSDAKRRCG